MRLNERPKCVCRHSYRDHIGQTQDDDGMCHVYHCGCERYERKIMALATFEVQVMYDTTDWDEDAPIAEMLANLTRPTEGSDVVDFDWNLQGVEVR